MISYLCRSKLEYNSMYTIKNYHQLVDQAIDQLTYPKGSAGLYAPIDYMMHLGGKRVRPILLLMASHLFSDEVEKAIAPAIGIELFHNFTLMHDDIMDKAPTRRGQPTVHERWSETAAILSGDVMLIEAYKRMMQVHTSLLPQVLSLFNEMAVGVCQGQQMDMSFETIDHITADDYLEMIRLKTAVLLAGSLKIGAIIGGASPAEAQLLYTFGETLGIAFQLQDDILDVYGDPDKFGKQIGGDILSNKKTFLLIKALELAHDHTAQQLQFWLNNTSANPVEKVGAVTDIYDQLHIRQIAQQARNNFADRALAALDDLQLDVPKKAGLRSFAEQILVRVT